MTSLNTGYAHTHTPMLNSDVGKKEIIMPMSMESANSFSQEGSMEKVQMLLNLIAQLIETLSGKNTDNPKSKPMPLERDESMNKPLKGPEGSQEATGSNPLGVDGDGTNIGVPGERGNKPLYFDRNGANIDALGERGNKPLYFDGDGANTSASGEQGPTGHNPLGVDGDGTNIGAPGERGSTGPNPLGVDGDGTNIGAPGERGSTGPNKPLYIDDAPKGRDISCTLDVGDYNGDGIVNDKNDRKQWVKDSKEFNSISQDFKDWFSEDVGDYNGDGVNDKNDLKQWLKDSKEARATGPGPDIVYNSATAEKASK